MNRNRITDMSETLQEIGRTITKRVEYAESKKTDDAWLSKAVLEEVARAERELKHLRRLMERKEASVVVATAAKNLTKLIATDLRSPLEKSFGLEPGEAYGADEEVMTELGSKTISGYKVEFDRNENTSAINAWVKGLGSIWTDYRMDDLEVTVKDILKRVRAGEDLKAVKNSL